MIAASVETLPEPKKKPKFLEKEKHRQVFAYYFALGSNRTLGQVCEHFNLKLSLVEKWSSVFEWKSKIAALESRGKSDHFRDQVSDLLLMLLASLTKPQKETGVPELTASPKTVAETIKLCVSSFKELRVDQRDGEPGEENPGEGRGKNVPKVMVNVIFKGLD